MTETPTLGEPVSGLDCDTRSVLSLSQNYPTERKTLAVLVFMEAGEKNESYCGTRSL